MRQLSLIILVSFLNWPTFSLSAICCDSFQEDPCNHDMSHIEGINEFDQVLLLIQKWLAAMHEVGRWKQMSGIPTADLRLERQLLEENLTKAINLGVSPIWLNSFIKAQLDAAKVIQDCNLKFSGQGKCGDRACDFATELYPYLSEISAQIFEKMGKIYPFLKIHTSSCHFLIQSPLSQRPIDRLPPNAWIKALSPFCSCGRGECHLHDH